MHQKNIPENIWLAAGDGDLQSVTLFVDGHGLSPNVPDEHTYTPMHAAASYGHIDILQFLISRGGDVNIVDDDGDTPLYTVEDIKTAQFLVEQGAIVDRTNNEGVSPIEHLRSEFPRIAAYLESLSHGPAGPVVHIPVSQHSQNVVSDSLTDHLIAQISMLADTDEDGLQRTVTASVLESLAQGQALSTEAEAEAEAEAEPAHDKRPRLL